jgi:predicted Zn-dependent peptidase
METIEIEQMVEENEESIDPKTDQKLSKLADMQRANSRNLRNNADEGMKVLEEAARNPIFDQKAIEDFTETLGKDERCRIQ